MRRQQFVREVLGVVPFAHAGPDLASANSRTLRASSAGLRSGRSQSRPGRVAIISLGSGGRDDTHGRRDGGGGGRGGERDGGAPTPRDFSAGRATSSVVSRACRRVRRGAWDRSRRARGARRCAPGLPGLANLPAARAPRSAAGLRTAGSCRRRVTASSSSRRARGGPARANDHGCRDRRRRQHRRRCAERVAPRSPRVRGATNVAVAAEPASSDQEPGRRGALECRLLRLRRRRPRHRSAQGLGPDVSAGSAPAQGQPARAPGRRPQRRDTSRGPLPTGWP